MDDAVDVMRSSEQSATNNAPKAVSEDLSDARSNEDSGGSFFNSDGDKKGRSNRLSPGELSRLSKLSTGEIIRRKGPLGFIIAIGVLTATILGGALSTQPFSLIAQFKETFNTMQTSANRRSNSWLRYQLKENKVKDPIKKKLLGMVELKNGSDEATFKISETQKEKLASQGIVYDDDFDGNGTRVLKFDDGTGKIQIVAADTNAAQRLNSEGVGKYAAGGVEYNSKVESFGDLYNSNSDFSNGYNAASRTWRGAIANWFNKTTANFLSKNKITRNLFKNFIDRVNKAQDGNSKTVALELIAKGTDEFEGGGMKVGEYEKDQDGELTRDENNKLVPKSETEDVNNGKIKRSTLTVDSVKAKLDTISDGAQKGVNYVCMITNVLSMAGLLASASETLQIIHLVTSFFEAVDKVKAGDGANSPMNDLMSTMNEKKKNKNEKIVLDKSKKLNIEDESKPIELQLSNEEVVTEKSAMESSGIVSLYSGDKVDSNDASVQSFNFSSSINIIVQGIGLSMEAFQACTIAKVTVNLVSATISAGEIFLCLAGVFGAAATAGASTGACGLLVANFGRKVATGVIFSHIMANLIALITPVVAKMMMRDLITNIGGEDLGNALTSGANKYLGSTYLVNGGSLGSIKKFESFTVEQQKVIAEDARLERQTKSPFDVTSKNTFMGALASKMMGFLAANSFASTIASAGSIISSSIRALSPAATAYNIADNIPKSMDDYAKTCPYLASIGAIGDAFCNPYIITDLDTINEDPAGVIGKIEEGNLDSNGEIIEDSDLAKYIIFCNNRDSEFGVADQNIASQVSSFGTSNSGNKLLDNSVNGFLGTVPLLGDVIDIVGSSDAMKNIGYISGQSCVAGFEYESDEVRKDRESPDWNKAKYYQRFIEDQSLAETTGLVEKSAVTAFIEDYYEKNPLDNSYEGILARYSGLSKDNVVAVLEIMDYYNYIAEYDATERYAFGAPAVEVDSALLFDNNNTLAGGEYIILMNNIVLADIRNRSFVV